VGGRKGWGLPGERIEQTRRRGQTYISRDEERERERERWGGPRLELNIHVFGAFGVGA
jgi:hypothetical protein